MFDPSDIDYDNPLIVACRSRDVRTLSNFISKRFACTLSEALYAYMLSHVQRYPYLEEVIEEDLFLHRATVFAIPEEEGRQIFAQVLIHETFDNNDYYEMLTVSEPFIISMALEHGAADPNVQELYFCTTPLQYHSFVSGTEAFALILADRRTRILRDWEGHTCIDMIESRESSYPGDGDVGCMGYEKSSRHMHWIASAGSPSLTSLVHRRHGRQAEQLHGDTAYHVHYMGMG